LVNAVKGSIPFLLNKNKNSKYNVWLAPMGIKRLVFGWLAKASLLLIPIAIGLAG
jgi:hypothetical protein